MSLRCPKISLSSGRATIIWVAPKFCVWEGSICLGNDEMSLRLNEKEVKRLYGNFLVVLLVSWV